MAAESLILSHTCGKHALIGHMETEKCLHIPGRNWVWGGAGTVSPGETSAQNVS